MKTKQLKYKERPRCRKYIEEKLLPEGHELFDIGKGHSWNKHTFYSDGLKKQARKMLQEEMDER